MKQTVGKQKCRITNLLVTQRNLNRISQISEMCIVDELPPVEISLLDNGCYQLENGHHRCVAYFLNGKLELDYHEYNLNYPDVNRRYNFGTFLMATTNLWKEDIMTKIVLPEKEDDKKDEDQLEINYKPTEKDEEFFFLMYHMNFQPSEVKSLDDDYRQWLVARYIAQKNMEQEAYQRHKLMDQIGPELKSGGDFRVDG